MHTDRFLTLQGRRYHYIESGAGHTVPGDQPALFQSLVREFLMP